MRLDFEFEQVRYVMNFECADCERDIFELRVYYSLKPDGIFSSSLRKIKDNKVLWYPDDDLYLSKAAQHHCDRMIKCLAFA